MGKQALGPGRAGRFVPASSTKELRMSLSIFALLWALLGMHPAHSVGMLAPTAVMHPADSGGMVPVKK